MFSPPSNPDAFSEFVQFLKTKKEINGIKKQEVKNVWLIFNLKKRNIQSNAGFEWQSWHP